jgi:hypothetical protein
LRRDFFKGKRRCGGLRWQRLAFEGSGFSQGSGVDRFGDACKGFQWLGTGHNQSHHFKGFRCPQKQSLLRCRLGAWNTDA